MKGFEDYFGRRANRPRTEPGPCRPGRHASCVYERGQNGPGREAVT